MKKQIIPLALVSTLLVGCGSSSEVTYNSQITDGDKAVITVGDDKVTNNELYHYLLKQFGGSETLALALTYIADQEITDQDAIKAKIDENLKKLSENATVPLDEYVKQLGYNSQQEYIDDVLSVGVKQELLKEKYVEKNYKKLVKEYKVKYLKVITVDTESGALNLIDQIKKGADFDTVSNENNGKDLGIVTTKSTSVDSKIIKNLDKFNKDGLYDKVIKTSESKYAVVYVYNTDKTNLEDEIKKNLSSIAGMSTKMEEYYLKAYNFEVYEEAIEDEIKETNKNYLG